MLRPRSTSADRVVAAAELRCFLNGGASKGAPPSPFLLNSAAVSLSDNRANGVNLHRV